MTDLGKPLVSIIIPVYNAEKYLDRCMENVVGQSYMNLEILLIENGSTDQSRKQCDIWAEKDSRIKTVHLDTADLSLAKNTGLEIARGEWISFIDSDDIPHLQFIEMMVNAGISDLGQGRPEIIDCDWRQIPGKRKWKRKRIIIYEGQEYARAILRGHNSGMAVWNKMFSNKLIPWLRFSEGHKYESKVALIRAALHSRKVCLIPEQLYHYYVHTESITHALISKYEEDRVYSAKQLIEMVSETNPVLLPEAKSMAIKLFALSWLRLQLCEDSTNANQYQRYIRTHINENKYGKMYEKIVVLMTAYTPSLSSFLYRFNFRRTNQ